MAGFPVAGFSFKVASDLWPEEVQFLEVSGLSMEYDVEEVIDGTNNGFMRKIPKRAKYTPVVLKKGIMQPDQLKSLIGGLSAYHLKDNVPTYKKDLTITLQDEKGAAVMTFQLIAAFPIKFNIGKFNGQENSIAMEELTFIYQDLKIS